MKLTTLSSTIRTLAAFAVMTSAFASISHADLTVYLDRVSWEAALGGATPVVEDLNAVAPMVFTDGDSLVTSKLTITRDGSPNSADGALEIRDGSSFGNIDGTTFLYGESGIEPHEVTKIDFLGTDAFAFGADFASPFSGDGMGLEVLGEVVLLDSIDGFDTGFVGVVSTDPFDSVSLVGTVDTLSFQELWQADNISYAAVPEPALAGWLLILGLLSIRRR